MKIDYKKIERLETITMKIEKVKESNPVIEDIKWLVKELRNSWKREAEKKTHRRLEQFKDY